jgi:hypothetical protein
MAARTLQEAGQKLQRKAVAASGKYREAVAASPGPCSTITQRYGIPCNIDNIWKQETTAAEGVWASAIQAPDVPQKWVQGFTRGVSMGAALR